MNGFVFSDSIIIGHYVGGLGQRCPSSVLYFSDKGNYIDTIPNIIPELGTGQVGDINNISVRKGFGLLEGIIQIQYNNGKQSICVPDIRHCGSVMTKSDSKNYLPTPSTH